MLILQSIDKKILRVQKKMLERVEQFYPKIMRKSLMKRAIILHLPVSNIFFIIF